MDSSFCVAVHALLCLRLRDRQLSSEALAEAICTNPSRIRKVLAPLKQAGLVATHPGSEGGYRLNTDPDLLTLDRVADALGVCFVSTLWHSGGDVPGCSCCCAGDVSRLLDGVFRELDRLCRERLSRITLSQLAASLNHPRQPQPG